MLTRHSGRPFWALLPALAQTAVCALTGYGLARYDFPLKKLLMALVLVTFIVPPYILLVPNYMMFSDYGMIGTLKTLVYPAMLGQGTKSAIFILDRKSTRLNSSHMA